MLFALKSLRGSWFYFLECKEYTVGRKDNDLIITDDTSISRQHAVIKITEDSAVICDSGSKYKTFVNNCEIQPNVEHVLNHKDEIRFGMLSSKYAFRVMSIQTTGSRLSLQQSNDLKDFVSTLKGKVSDTWTSECTHLTVEEIVLSMKVLHAIIDEKPIVNLKYWETFVENIKLNIGPPSVGKFEPPVAEALLSSVSIEPDSARKTLFVGKIFVFDTEKAKKQMEGIITKSGGTCISWQKEPFTVDTMMRSKDEYLIMHNEKENPKSLEEIVEFLKTQNKRTIPVQEIAMAIVLCSCVKDCNPNFNKARCVFKKEESSEAATDQILAGETPSEYFSASEMPVDAKIMGTVPDTMDLDVNLAGTSEIKQSTKRPSCDEPVGVGVGDQQQKKAKLDASVLSVNNNKPHENVTSIKPKLSEKRDNTNKTETEVVPGKRKADTVLEESFSKKEKKTYDISQIKSRKSINTISAGNPFDSLKPKVDSILSRPTESNPFKGTSQAETSSTRSIQLTQNSSVVSVEINTENNQFSQPSKQKEGGNMPVNGNPFQKPSTGSRKELSICDGKNNPNNIFTSTAIQDKSRDVNTIANIDISKIGHATKSTQWLGKHCIRNSLIVETEMDPELEAYCRSFKNTCIVKTVPNLIVRGVNSSDITDGNSKLGPGCKNFKKFKKVKPLKPQTIVIGQSSLIRYKKED